VADINARSRFGHAIIAFNNTCRQTASGVECSGVLLRKYEFAAWNPRLETHSVPREGKMNKLKDLANLAIQRISKYKRGGSENRDITRQ